MNCCAEPRIICRNFELAQVFRHGLQFDPLRHQSVRQSDNSLRSIQSGAAPRSATQSLSEPADFQRRPQALHGRIHSGRTG